MAIIVLAGMALGSGCERGDGIAVYQAPKEPQQPTTVPVAPAALPAAAAPGAQAGTPAPHGAAPIGWTVPSGWTALPGGQMRYAAFAVDQSNPSIVLTVIPLGLEAGRILPNVNRWEQQLGLPPSAEADLPTVVRRVGLPGGDVAHVVDLTSAQDAGGQQQRMLAAIVQRPDRVWFFKLVGPSQIVAGQKDEFDAFIQSVRFPAAALGAALPASAPAAQQPAQQ